MLTDQSDWMVAYANGTDANLVALMSLSRGTFNKLPQSFKNHYLIRTLGNEGKGGRPTKFRYQHQALGLILVYYCDTIGSSFSP